TESGVAAAAAPLAVRWDKRDLLAGQLKGAISQIMARLNTTSLSDDERADAASDLLSLRRKEKDILPSVAALLGSSSSMSLQKRIAEFIGGINDPKVGPLFIAAYQKAAPEVQSVIFSQLIRRPS